MAAPGASGGKPLVLRLGLLVLGVLLPAIAFAGLVFWNYASAERARLEDKAITLARSGAVAVDREFSALIAAADILALSTGAQAGDLAAFERSAGNVERRLRVSAKLLALDGTELGTEKTFKARTADVQRVVEKGEAIISEYAPATAPDGGGVYVLVPVRNGGELRNLLALQVPSDRLRSVLLSEAPPADWVMALIDQGGTIVARNRAHDAFVGRRATADLLANTTGAQGTWLGYTQEGTPVLGAYHRTRLADWRLAVGVARATLNAPLYRSFWVLAAVALVLGALSVLLTYRSGRQITSALEKLVLEAATLGRGDVVTPPTTAVREVNAVGMRLAEASQELRARHLAEERAAAADRRIRTIFESIADSVFVLDRQWRFTYLNSRARDQISGGRELLGQNVWEAFPDAVGGELWRAYHQALESGEVTYAEEFYPPLGRWLAASAYPSPEGVTVYFRDITAEKEAQEQQALMVRELHHRVRNLLSTVQAIANASARSARSLQNFRDSFLERLAALSRSHTLLMQKSWGRILLADLLRVELEPYTAGTDRVRLNGPDVELPSDVALAFGLAIHELTTNAVKHGSLSSPVGRVEVQWTAKGSEENKQLHFKWRETGGPPAQEPERTGFGSQLLERVLRRQLGAEVDIMYLSSGLKVDVRAPLRPSAA